MSEIGRFTAPTRWGPEEVPYEKEFVLWGETFVVHHKVSRPGELATNTYRVSHKETGHGIPDVNQSTVAAAEDQARAVMEKYGRKRVLAVIEKARRS